MPHQRVIDNVATVPVLRGRVPPRSTAGGLRCARTRRPRSQAGHPLPGAVVRRSAAARRGGAGARRRPADPADGRAVQRRRPGGPRRSCRPRSCGCRTNCARRSCSSPTTSTRRSNSATRSRCSAPAAACSSTTHLRGCCPTRPTTSWRVSSGADRGYRGLQFRHATGLPIHELRHVGEDGIDALNLGADEWVLVTKPDGSPYAWVNAEGVTLHRSGAVALRQHHRRRLAVPAGRHAAAGPGRGAVVAVGAGRGRRRRQHGGRRCARRRRAGRPGATT